MQERCWTDRQDEVPFVATDAFNRISSGLAEHGPEADGNVLRCLSPRGLWKIPVLAFRRTSCALNLFTYLPFGSEPDSVPLAHS